MTVAFDVMTILCIRKSLTNRNLNGFTMSVLKLHTVLQFSLHAQIALNWVGNTW